MRREALLTAAALFAAAPALAADVPVDLELVIAVDVSQSMDLAEQRIQRDGYVDAFRSRAVQEAIAAGAYGKIAVTYVEWAGVTYQSIVVPWRIIAGKDDADAFAYRLDAAPLAQQILTSISAALSFGGRQFASSGADGERRAIDVSGDGHNNSGPAVASGRDLLVEEGIVVNGLPIMIHPVTGPAAIIPLDTYYRECVIGGGGSFMVVATSAATFKEAIQRKLILEIAGARPAEATLVPAAAAAPNAPAVDCLIGEKAFGAMTGR